MSSIDCSVIETATRKILSEDASISVEPVAAYTSHKTTCYFLCSCSDQRYFVRVTPQAYPEPNAELNAYLRVSRPPDAYTAPRLCGVEIVGDMRVEVWEHVTGATKLFEHFSDDELLRVVRGIAGNDAAPPPTFALPETFWLKSTWSRFEASEHADVLKMKPRAASLLPAFERTVIKRARALGPRCLIHNDLHGHNVMLSADRCFVLDWESASFGTPGASLRAFLDLSEDRHAWITESYVAFMKKFGAPVRIEDVRYSMRVHHAFALIRSGTRKAVPHRINRGLSLFESLL